MTKRTDIHSPTNLVTEDYEYAYSYDAHPEEGDRRFAMSILNALIDEGWRFGQVHGGDTCDHCGHALRYVAVLKHIPTHTLIKVGEQCLDNRFDLASADFHKLRKAAALNRERRALRSRRNEWFAIDPDREVAYAFAAEHGGYDEFGERDWLTGYVHTVDRYGSASDKWTKSIMRAMVRRERREEERAREAALAQPVVEGNIQVTGEIVSLKLHENSYGTREVMIVKDDRGFKVWGTQPRSIYDAKVGDRVTFEAQVDKSDRDETFGFFKRPRKAEVL